MVALIDFGGGEIGCADPLDGELFKVNECALQAFFIFCHVHLSRKWLAGHAIK